MSDNPDLAAFYRARYGAGKRRQEIRVEAGLGFV